jgi:membrane protein YdbS with pleckstrin-like domain
VAAPQGPERPEGVAAPEHPEDAARPQRPERPFEPSRRPVDGRVSSSPPVERPTPEPTRRLARGARALWTLEALAAALPVLGVTAIVSVALDDAAWAPAVLVSALWAVVAIAVVVRVAAVPQLRWRRWRYEVRESEIDLRRGAFTVRRTLVPMSRVQHVDTRRTVFSQLFGLAAVVFHTAAGANEIPALTEAEAAAIRDAIADLSSMSDDPV